MCVCGGGGGGGLASNILFYTRSYIENEKTKLILQPDEQE